MTLANPAEGVPWLSLLTVGRPEASDLERILARLRGEPRPCTEPPGAQPAPAVRQLAGEPEPADEPAPAGDPEPPDALPDRTTEPAGDELEVPS